jgi:hypothetical protein
MQNNPWKGLKPSESSQLLRHHGVENADNPWKVETAQAQGGVFSYP